MKELYLAISRDTRKSKKMRELAFDLNSKQGIELRKQQNDLYKRTEFKKKFLRARNELNGRECTENN